MFQKGYSGRIMSPMEYDHHTYRRPKSRRGKHIHIGDDTDKYQKYSFVDREGNFVTKLQALWIFSKGECHYCKKKIPLRKSTKDHRIPLARGGTHSMSNLVLSCKTCNLRKGPLTEDEYFRAINIMPAVEYGIGEVLNGLINAAGKIIILALGIYGVIRLVQEL